MLKDKEKQEKLAQAMRANLAKRKQQARARKNADQQQEQPKESK